MQLVPWGISLEYGNGVDIKELTCYLLLTLGSL